MALTAARVDAAVVHGFIRLDAIHQLVGPKALAHSHLAGTVAVRFPSTTTHRAVSCPSARPESPPPTPLDMSLTDHRPVDLAGDVYLGHPFLVHAAHRHRGTAPRALAQPGVLLTEDYTQDDTAPVADVLAWP